MRASNAGRVSGSDSARVTHVIFDCDQTLINSLDVYLDIFRDVADQFDKQLPETLEEKLYTAASPKQFVPEFLDFVGMRDERELVFELISDSYGRHESRLRLMAGAERLVRHLSASGIPMAIATAAKLWLYESNTANFAELLRPPTHISHVVSSDDDLQVERDKPCPDVYAVCAERFDPPPVSTGAVLVVEDNLVCADAAKSLGMRTVLVRTPERRYGWDDDHCSAHVTLTSLDQFRPERFGLPPFRDET